MTGNGHALSYDEMLKAFPDFTHDDICADDVNVICCALFAAQQAKAAAKPNRRFLARHKSELPDMGFPLDEVQARIASFFTPDEWRVIELIPVEEK